MNTNTGHLVDLREHPECRADPDYQPLPPHLHAAASEGDATPEGEEGSRG